MQLTTGTSMTSSSTLLRLLLLPLLLLLTVLTVTQRLAAQPADAADTLLARSLFYFDLPSFEWSGQPDPPSPRLGIYSNPIPADSNSLIAGMPSDAKGFRIWHIMPHWSADEGGLYINDIILKLNGKAIGDSSFQGDEYMSVAVRPTPVGGKARFTILRDGKVIDVDLPILRSPRTVMAYHAPAGLPRAYRESWFAKTIAEQGLTEWAATIQKQMRIVADQDFNTVPFSDSPSPWRLNTITYLHHNPTRLGAVARALDNDLWRGCDQGPGLAGALDAAAADLDIPVAAARILPAPRSTEDLKIYLEAVKNDIDNAYRTIGGLLDSTTRGLAEILDMNSTWETSLDSIVDRKERRATRIYREKRTSEFFRRANSVSMPDLISGAHRLATLADSAWVCNFAQALEATIGSASSASSVSGVEGNVLLSWNTPAGMCVVGGSGPNRYTGDFAFILDVGGDDIYNLPQLKPGKFRYVADRAGNDLYANDRGGQGSGIGGVEVLVDVQGDDTYRANSFAQGAGLLGVGILADFAGDDIYFSRWASQGAGYLGIGILYEGGGADNYNAEVFSQGFAYIRGFGAILENGGNDSYRAGWKYPDSRYPGRAHLSMSQGFGYGMRPWSIGVGTDGGIGVLSDRHGHDLYAADFFSQGGSYWYALGILHDAEGCDRYTAGQYSQGSGIHLSFGALLDDAGDDMYDAYHGLEQGNAHDWSSGCLEDAAGNDTYRGSSASQGSALTVAFAWLMDGGGTDQYYVLLNDTVSSQGGGRAAPVRNAGSLGVLLDLGKSNDYYVDPRIVQGKLLMKSNKGIVYDDGMP